MNKEEIEKYYNEKIIAKENIDKEELIYNIVSIFTTMNNFEDWLCDDMQDKVANIKQYIQQLEQENEDLKIKNNMKMLGTLAEIELKELIKSDFISKDTIKEKMEKLNKVIEEKRIENITLGNATKYDYLIIGKRDAFKELLSIIEERGK